MIYSRDLWIQLPTKDLYNTQVMMAAVNAAKDMYDKGQKRLDDFYEKYGDFMSPFSKDMDRYGQLILGITNPIEDMYAQGIDPLRSAEGRALVNRLVNAFPISEFNVMKANAKHGEQYLKDISDLRSKDLFDLDYENWLIGQQYGKGTTFENFDSSKGIWNRTPGVYKTIDDIVEPIVKNLLPIFDAEYTKRMNDGFDYSTVTPDRILSTLNDSIPDIMNTDIGKYYFSQALRLASDDPTAANALFKDWMLNRARDHVRIDRKENPYAAMKAQEQKEKNVAGYREWLLRTRPSKDNSNNGSNNSSFKYTNQRIKLGVANLLVKSGVGNTIGVSDGNGGYLPIVTPEFVTDQTIPLIGQHLKSAQKEIIHRAFDIGDGGNTATRDKKKKQNYLNAILFDLDPQTFAMTIGGKDAKLDRHPNARWITVDKNTLNKIYDGNDIVTSAQGVTGSKNQGKESLKVRDKIKYRGVNLQIDKSNNKDKSDSKGGYLSKSSDGGYLSKISGELKQATHVKPSKIAIEGNGAICQIEKDGILRQYVKITLLDEKGRDIFPGRNIYYFDGIESYGNPDWNKVGMEYKDFVNIYPNSNNGQLERMYMDQNYANFIKTPKKDIDSNTIIPGEYEEEDE